MHILQDHNLLKTQAFIGGEFVGRGTLAVANPSTGAVVSMVPDLGADAAEQAVAAAQTAFQAWSETPDGLPGLVRDDGEGSRSPLERVV